jgi:hypothetical protein
MPRAIHIALIPADPSRLPPVSVPYPTPSIAHSLVPCDRCGADSWIGPQQLATRTLTGAEAICYYCFLAAVKSGEIPNDLAWVALNPDADKTPRRTT